jgi:hypothetical protein
LAISVQKVQLWAAHGSDRSGLLADALEPLAAAGADLRSVMTYCHAGESGRATVEVYPVSGRRAQAAARAAGLAPSATPCLFVAGDDRPGLGARLSRAVASVGVSMSVLVAQSTGKRFSAMLGFKNSTDAAIAAKALRSLPSEPRRRRVSPTV